MLAQANGLQATLQAIGTDLARVLAQVESVGGAVHATSNVCSRGHAWRCDGFLLDHEIECPLHQGCFDIRNGAPTCGPADAPIRC